jgi:predicted nucleic acid-binding protein
MYLVDTDVISEIRKGDKADRGVRAFFADMARQSVDLYLSVVTIGELRQGVERIRHRGDDAHAKRLSRWLKQVTTIYAESILPFRFGGDCGYQIPRIRWTSKLQPRRSFMISRW